MSTKGTPPRLAKLVIAAALLATSGCGRAAKPPAPADVYTVRGEIVSLPGARGEILIRHEAVPELRDAAGKTVGMESMTMPFALADPVDRSALAVGDRIEFVLEVRWDASNPVSVTKISKLAPGTRLAFDEPQPEGATPDAPEGETPR